MGVLKSRKCGAGFPGCDRAGWHIPELYIYFTDPYIYILMWLKQGHLLCRHVHGIHCMSVFDRSLATWCCSGVSGCEPGGWFAPWWCWRRSGPVCPSLCWQALLETWHCSSLVRPYLFQRLLKGRRQLPASSRQCFLARDCTSAMVSLSLLGRGSLGWQDIASQGPDMFLHLMPLPPMLCPFPACSAAQFPLALQAAGCTDTQTWLLQHIPAELKLTLTQLKL